MKRMDREKVIKALEHCKDNQHVNDCEECDYGGKTEMFCIRLIDDALALLKEQEWHLLTEDDDGIIHGLPGDDGQYLMTDGKDIWIDDYVDGVDDGVWLDSGRDVREITAWMYMPKLPKERR